MTAAAARSMDRVSGATSQEEWDEHYVRAVELLAD